MTYTTSEGRQRLLDQLAEAIDEIGYALAALGAAYEQLDQATADKLEEDLFGPVQRAFGRAKRTHSAFAERAGLEAGSFDDQSAGLPSTGAKGFIENAAAAMGAAGGHLATLQDDGTFIEVGDVQLRKDVAELRATVDEVPQRARDLVRRLGR